MSIAWINSRQYGPVVLFIVPGNEPGVSDGFERNHYFIEHKA